MQSHRQETSDNSNVQSYRNIAYTKPLTNDVCKDLKNDFSIIILYLNLLNNDKNNID